MLSSFGLKPGEIARIIVFNVVTFWLGFAAIGGGALAFEPSKLPTGWLSAASRPIGIALLAALSAYLVVSARRREPLLVRGFEVSSPGARLAAAQIAHLDRRLGARRGGALRAAAPRAGADLPAAAQRLRAGRGARARVEPCRPDSGSSTRRWFCCWAASCRATSCWPACSRTGSSTTSCRWPSRSCSSGASSCCSGARRSRAGASSSRSGRRSWCRASFAAIAFLAGAVLLASGATPAAPHRIALLRAAGCRSRCSRCRTSSAAVDRRRAAAAGARPAAAPRRRLLRGARAARRRSGRVAPEGVRLGGGVAAHGDGR